MLSDRLRRYMESSKLVGYCPWDDGIGLLFGYVTSLTESQVTFSLIDALGAPDITDTVALDSIVRLSDSPDYVARLIEFGELRPRPEDAKGQSTRSPNVIMKRLREAAKTGECVRLKLLGDPFQIHRVFSVHQDYCETEEYGDNPHRVVSTHIVRLDQIQELRWRDGRDAAVTRLWAADHRL